MRTPLIVAVLAAGAVGPAAAQYSAAPRDSMRPTPSAPAPVRIIPGPQPPISRAKPTGKVYLPGLYIWTAEGTPNGTVSGELVITGDPGKYISVFSGEIPEGMEITSVVLAGSHVTMKGTAGTGTPDGSFVLEMDAGGDNMVGRWSVEGSGSGPFSATRQPVPGAKPSKE